MSSSVAGLAIRRPPQPGAFPALVDLTALPPTLIKRPPPQSPAPVRRTKLWELGGSLHCSIIGTCLSAQELRHLLTKLKRAPEGASDHDLHSLAVGFAGRHEEPARQLHKALDLRHRLVVNQFAKATNEASLRALWAEAVKRGDIPGAYWATLTHQFATQAVIREAFGNVHMLSHLVGSANRADLKRLCLLEAEKSDLEARLVRQQEAFHTAVVSRDAQIAALRQSLAQQIAAEAQAPAADPDDAAATLRGLVADLETRLSAEIRRRQTAEERLAAVRSDLGSERAAREKADRTNAGLHRELAAAEALLHPGDAPAPVWLDGEVLLYVGGRPSQTAHLRAGAEALGAEFLHHDGGIECHQSLLPGLVSRSDLIVFPVDCISHDAALNLKALCRQAGKAFVPVRTASVTALLAALRTVAEAEPLAASRTVSG
jgi:Uncharacterized protein conserved in bacteria (DUF2325)